MGLSREAVPVNNRKIQEPELLPCLRRRRPLELNVFDRTRALSQNLLNAVLLTVCHGASQRTERHMRDFLGKPDTLTTAELSTERANAHSFGSVAQTATNIESARVRAMKSLTQCSEPKCARPSPLTKAVDMLAHSSMDRPLSNDLR